jgi:hypothetical protein
MTIAAFCSGPQKHSAVINPFQRHHLTQTQAMPPYIALNRLNQATPLPFAQQNTLGQRRPPAHHPLMNAPPSLRTALSGSYWPESDYPEHAIKAPLKLSYSPLGQSAYPIFEISDPKSYPEFPATSNPVAADIDAAQFLRPGSFYLSFGDTDVHAGEIINENTIRKLQPTGCPFNKTKVSHSDGSERSGLFFVPSDLPVDARKALYQAVEKMASSHARSTTSTLVDLLTTAGFELTAPQHGTRLSTKNEVDNYELKQCHTPVQLLQGILKYGLSFKGAPLPARIINTTGRPLSTLKNKLDHAPIRASLQQMQQILTSAEHTAQRQELAKTIRANTPAPIGTSPAASHPEDPTHPIKIATAKTSPTGALLRRFISPHVLFKIQLDADAITRHLSTRLKPFAQKNPDIITRLKKDLFFPPSTAKRVSNLMAEAFETRHSITGAELLSLLENQSRKVIPSPHTSETPNIFNCIITDDALILGQVKAGCLAIDDVLSKHVLLAEYADVRFAGEIYAQNNTLFVTRNSGTYRPTALQLNGTTALLNEQFSFISIESDDNEQSK